MLVKVMSNTLMRNVAADHQDCDAELVQPDLAWTIVRPPRLLDGPPTGRARILAGHLPKGGFTITRADVAAFMLQETVKPNFIRQVVGISK
jgi:uncharacterized protein YbjT (DUF2867 family)